MFRAGSFVFSSGSNRTQDATAVAKSGKDEEAPAEVSQSVGAKTRRLMSNYRGMASCLAYMLSSTSMVLMNKLVLSSFGFGSTNCLLLYQTIWCVVIVKGLHLMGRLKLEKLTYQLMMAWLPINVIFVGMIWTSFFALKYLGVAMMTVLKNSTNLLVVVGDIAFFG